MHSKLRSLSAGKLFFLMFGWHTALPLAVFACASNASATTIALWTFETSTPANVDNAAVYPNAIPNNSGVGTGNAGGTHVAVGTDWTTPEGNGSSESFNSNNWGQFDYYQFTVDTTGYKDITLSWDQTRSSTSAPGFFSVLYSSTGTGGIFSSALSGYTALVNSPAWSPTPANYQPAYTNTLNLSIVSALNNNANVVFRLSADITGTNAGATVRVDNFLVSGTAIPEPGTLAMMLFGGLALWLFGGQRKRKR